MQAELLDDIDIFVIHDFLSRAECQRWIDDSEALGYGDAPITTSVGFVMRKDVRDNERVIHDSPKLADAWWQRARPFLPAEWSRWQIVGFNERFRFYRYDPGQKFAKHTDGYFERDNGERSHLTFMVYLNEEFDGGETVFHDIRPRLRVKPRTGMALVFNHRRLHEGAPVISGRKYVLRTDVMYRRPVS
jgi:predicted 2-oxoglutarate/Fe(II)-dependent dioxygenase YbiX